MFENITRKFYAHDNSVDAEPAVAAAEVHSSPKNKFYADSEEKFLKRVVVYACSTGLNNPRKMYYDPDGVIPVCPDEAFDLFIKNLMIIGISALDGTTYYTPSSMMLDNGGYKFIIYDEGSVVSVFSSSNSTTETRPHTDDPDPGAV